MPSHKPTYGTFFEFEKDDVFLNRIKTFPKVDFFIYTGSVYYNNENQIRENPDLPAGHISLYELNVNRQAHSVGGDSQKITPFLTKGGSFYNFKTISTSDYNLDYNFGDKIEASYPLTASISIDRYEEALSTSKLNFLYALKNTLNFYTVLSPHYAYSSSLGDKENQPLNLISIPSIFYGSNIKKGSIFLKYYVSGTLVAEASDIKRNGELIQTSGTMVDHVIGVVLYNEGFLFITSSTAIDTHIEQYKPSDSTYYSASWNYFANVDSYSSSISSSYSITFKGVNYVETMTMFAHARENQLNFSNNPTFLSDTVGSLTESDIYHENSQTKIKNIVTSSYRNFTSSFKPITYISKVGIYDKDKNLIAIAGLANPVRKLEERGYTFKLKLDI
jgi:hypothetical protein